MKIEDKLEIVIPTFNRCEKLGITFSYLLDENSPVKNCDITILDNCSTDDTPNLVKKIAEKHPNVKYRRNARNIGVWENDLRGHEIASKEYLWKLGDNDTYDWTCWDQVEEAIENKADVIVMGYGTYSQRPKDLRIHVLIPGGVDVYPLLMWKNSNISDEIFRIARFYISNNFNAILGAILINEKPDLDVFAVEKDIIKWVRISPEERLRDQSKLLAAFPNQYNTLFSLMVCKDVKLRNNAIRLYVDTGHFASHIFTVDLSFSRDRILHADAWRVFCLLSWKWRFYLLTVGYYGLFKKSMRKIVKKLWLFCIDLREHG